MKSVNKGVNEVCLVGRRETDFRFSHRSRGTDYYVADFVTERDSGSLDRIPVTLSEWQREMLAGNRDRYLHIEGYFQSFNRWEQGRRRLILSVFANAVNFSDRETEAAENRIYLEGYVCKETVYRTTPAGMRVTDIMMAVNRPYKGTDYLPCISWGKFARRAAGFPVGEHIWLSGRIQSREYLKDIGDGTMEKRTAYEVSAYEVDRLGM